MIEILKLICQIILLIIVATGVIAICDARSLSKKLFSSIDRNVAVNILRIMGFILSIATTIFIYIIK